MKHAQRCFERFECFCNVVHQSAALRRFLLAERARHIIALIQLDTVAHTRRGARNG